MPLHSVIYSSTWIDVSGLLCGSFCSWGFFFFLIYSAVTRSYDNLGRSVLCESTYVWAAQKFILHISRQPGMKNWKPQSTAPVCIWLREHAPVHIIHINAECYSFCHQRVRWHFSMALSASSKGDQLLILDWWHKVEVGDRPRTRRRHSALTLAN